MQDNPWREVAPVEGALLEKLVSVPFKGREQIALQFERAQVRTCDNEGSIVFSLRSQDKASVCQRVPVEGLIGEFHKPDAIHVLLHVVDGIVFELELYRNDGGPIYMGDLDASQMQVFVIASGEELK